MNRKKRLLGMYRMLLLAGCIALIGAGCGEQPPIVQVPPQMSEADDPDGIGVESDEPEVIILPFTAPLTGLGSEREMLDRPVMIMVENSPQARPQTGLGEADIIYEILAEGDITRFATVYHSQSPEVVGPVRSIRPYYVEIGEGLDALIAHAGWSQDAINMIKAKKLAHFDQVYGDDAYFWRSKERSMPNNLYTSLELLREGAVKKKFRDTWKVVKPLFQSSEDGIPLGESIEQVTISYLNGYKVSYEYDEDKGLFDRFMAGKPHVDKESGQQLAATNVLICFSKHRILDNVGRRSVDIAGPGKGFLLRNGISQEITWKRDGGIIRPYIDGKEIPLAPGQTWVQVVPEGYSVTFQ